MYKLTPQLRSELARPLAPVLTSKEALARINKGGYLISVGDVVTDTFLSAGIQPDVIARDGRTRRGEHKGTGIEPKPETVTFNVTNPAGTITEELWRAVVSAITAGRPAIIQVEGEEDLAVIPAVLLGPEGAHVAYGQPPVTDAGVSEGGIVLLQITPEQRARVKEMLTRMEVAHDGN